MDAARIAALADQAADIAPMVLPLDPKVPLQVDGDYCAYYFSGNDDTSLASSKRNLIDTVQNVAQIAGAGGQTIIHLTSGLSDKGGRFKIASIKPYQGQREGSRKPNNWEALRAWLESEKTLPGTNFRVVQWMDREADDGISAASRYSWQSGVRPAILMRDKDSRMMAGLHVDWTTFNRYEVRPETWKLDTGLEDSYGPVIYGQYFFWYQMLAGDTADAIPGLEKQPASKPGAFKACGGGCATEMLEGVTSSEQAYKVVKTLYEAFYGGSWPDRFVEQAALLWMRTDNAAYVGDFMRAIPAREPALEQALVRLEKRIR